MRYPYLLLFLLATCNLNAQSRHTISGTITDSTNGEHLVGVTIYDELSRLATVCNYYGYYSLSLPKGKVSVTYSYVGYNPVKHSFDLLADTVINLNMQTAQTIINEVVVTGHHPDVAWVQTGVIALKTNQIKTAPVLLGEADLLKTIQLLPGVKGGTEGSGGLYVRGGGPDQNLILLDGVPVYNTNHAFGFFSVFNPDAISGFTFYKGGMPARYGGRLSSVLDIKMKEGNNQKFSGEGSLGIISSKFTIEGPICNQNTSFIVSGRRTFLDLFTRTLNKLSQSVDPPPAYYFYDLNAKINHRFNNQHRLYFSIYSGSDYSGTKYNGISSDYLTKYKTTDGFGWGNFTSSARWNYLITNHLFSNITLIYSKYQFKVENKMEETEKPSGNLNEFINRYTSGIEDIGARWDLEYYTMANQNLRFGLSYTRHSFNPGITIIKDQLDTRDNARDTTFGNQPIFVNEAFAYAEDEFTIGRLTTNIGVHYALFSVQNKNYIHLQPRIALQYRINSKLDAKLSYGAVSQYLHLLTNTTIGMPTDLWLPATQKVKPEKARQYAVGVNYKLPNSYSVTAEVYYKEMENLIEYKEGASFYQINDSWEDKIEVGRGKAQGIELMLQKSEGKLTGWIGTTLSKSDRTFAGLNNGITFPYRYDSRFDISVLAMYKLSDRINISASWVLHTGNAITLALKKIEIFTGDTSINTQKHPYYVPIFDGRNNFRTPVYHRLDAGVDFIKHKKRITRTWSFGLYNVYNHLNAYYVYADLDSNKNPTLKQVTLFPILPYFRYNIKF